MGTFADPSSEAHHFRRRQISAYTHEYSITLLLPILARAFPVSTALATLQVENDADFQVTHLTGTVPSPVNADGSRLIQSTSDQLLTFGMAGSPNRSDHGVVFKISEPETGRALTIARKTQNTVDLVAADALSPWDRTFINMRDVFGPGYGFQWGHPLPFKLVIPRSKRIQVLFQGVEQGPYNGYQRVSMCFVGQRYDDR